MTDGQDGGHKAGGHDDLLPACRVGEAHFRQQFIPLLFERSLRVHSPNATAARPPRDSEQGGEGDAGWVAIRLPRALIWAKFLLKMDLLTFEDLPDDIVREVVSYFSLLKCWRCV